MPILLPIARFENRYLISSAGEVINLANNIPLASIENSNGYRKVGLADGKGNHKQLLLHRLVALHFIPNPYEYPEVNHKDGVKAHCEMNNLEWCSSAGNHEHAFRTGLRPGYMSADDKETYLREILAGRQVNDLAAAIQRTPETLHKMLRDTAKRLGIHDTWVTVMKENRRRAAIDNLARIARRNP
jgi:hypothetical protein